MNEVTNMLNAAAAAGPTVLLAIAITIFVWRGLPLLDKLVNGIDKRINENNQALAEVRTQIATSNQYNNANAKAVGEIAETFSMSMRESLLNQSQLVASIDQHNSTQSSMNNAVQQMAEASKSLHNVMEQSVEFEKKRHSALIGGISQVVTSVGDMSKELTGDLEELKNIIESRPRAATEEEYAWYKTNIQSILDCVTRIEGKLNGDPYKVTVPPGVTGFVVETEKKEEVSSEQV